MADLDGYVGFPGPVLEESPGARSGYVHVLDAPGPLSPGARSGDAIAPILQSTLLKALRRVPVIPANRTISQR